jgi:protein-disulfide isomerase
VASRKRDREQRRQDRLRAEAEERQRLQRQRLVKLGSAAVFLAIVVVAVAVALLGSGGGGGDGSKTSGAEARLLDTLPQNGTALGKPSAKATIIEFGDLQCPVCQFYSQNVVPELIEGPVRKGDAKIDFRSLLVIGPQSLPAAKAALAAGEQGRYWNFITAFYDNQQEENSGYVTDSFLTSIARQAKVPNLGKWNRDRRSPRLSAVVARQAREAHRLGFDATPSFVVTGPGGTQRLGTPGGAGPIEDAIAKVG